jgi:glycerol-3-phosphate acyltransferase PlsX
MRPVTVIAVDAMGGDAAPGPEVAAALAAAAAGIEVVLVGDEAVLRPRIAGSGSVRIRHASEVVTMDDHPAQAFRRKKDSSLRRAIEMVADGSADAVVSAGNSGAVLAAALLVLGRIPDVERPAIATVFPAPAGPLVLCDSGANVDVKASMLAQFGLLGACYHRVATGTPRPRLGLLSNGAEAGKGTELTRATHALLQRAAGSAFHYAGYVEGSDLFRGVVDVIATDGFTGNVMLKTCEGLAEGMFGLVKRELDGDLRSRVGAALVAPALRRIARRFDYAEIGGALLAGVRGTVLLCHGRSQPVAIENAIRAADHFVRGRLVTQLGEAIAAASGAWRAATA